MSEALGMMSMMNYLAHLAANNHAYPVFSYILLACRVAK